MGEKAPIPRKHEEKHAIDRREDKPGDDNPQPAGNDCPDGDDCIERQKRPVTLPRTPRENKLIQDIVKQEEPIAITGTFKGKPTLNRRCVLPNDFGCIDTKGNDEEPVDISPDNPVYKPAPKRRCIPPLCDGKPTLNRRCVPPYICIKRKEKEKEPADNQDAPVYKPAPKRQCNPPFCTGKQTLNKRCVPPDNSGCIDRKEKDEESTDNQDAPVYKPAPKRQCEPPACSGTL